ncbi:MAG TPA: heme lyase CcmF/NrfE family subunit [Thiolapillus brandeum]|uniref:Heme lyase CcmF/NrfE family subunit n=1 Tax=Thiolapillus brandeum TaxID=1076588 RepID=A0A7C5IZL1_9GAMM|nr:heme lyase CcmF/NrfE family subunit [Thiolapillus brandeum]
MIPEIGHFALILALVIALVQGVFPILGAHRGYASWVALAKPAAQLQFLMLLVSFACLTWAFLQSDFSVLYVAENSNTRLPQIFKFSAVWGAHEGSLLLWALILSAWTAAVTVFGRSLSPLMMARVIGVLGLVATGFLAFLIFTSNPFERLLPAVAEGRDLNPLLQDIGLVMHPPMLYMGYVGFAIPFAFAIAAMLGGRLDAAWARWSRPWTQIAWVFLTLGIALGSWWAYYELGWGGWWFWDPVENASFMPWLAGTALMHSLAVTEKRGAFKAWTVLLAIFTFSLSLLGTFLVRSGVLTSVHAFAADPSRGLFILLFLAVVVGSSLMLYAARASKVRSHVRFELVSRETALLLNNVILVVTTVSILLGTLYPLIIDALGAGKISVGPPYFNAVFIPLTVPLAILIGVGSLARWKRDSFANIWVKVRVAFVASLVFGILFPLVAMQHFSWQAALGMVLAFWVFFSSLKVMKEYARGRGIGGLSLSQWGMTFGHLGVAVFITGITLTSIYSSEKDVRLVPGDSFSLGGYEFLFKGTTHLQGPNYQGDRGEIVITREGEPVTVLYPEKRNYLSGMPMTEAGIDAGLTRDLFVALGEPLDDQGAWAVRIYHKPFVRWIWLGALIMALGGVCSAADKRYRLLARREREALAGGVA